MPSRARCYQNGFSLLELILLTALIAIIIAIAIPNLFAVIRVARESRALANIKTISNSQNLFYSSLGRYAIFEELFRRDYLTTSQYTRNVPTIAGLPSNTASEVVSDGAYDYSFRYSADAQGFTLDADPKKNLTATHRSFRYRTSRTTMAGLSGAMDIILVAGPSATSLPSAAYRPLRP
ncbi:MAG: hypothetical protein AB1489_00180 [Acidobacteriota bacterium]